jgi:ribosome-binding factor A
VNQILREVISDELLRISDVDERLGLLTVTGVETTPDMRQAMVYLDSLSEDSRVALEERHAQVVLHGRPGRRERDGRRGNLAPAAT